MGVFPLPLPPPIDKDWGREVLEENPEILTGDLLVNIKDWIAERVHYRLDEGNYNEWVPPATVLAEGSGDCEDVALMALSIAAAAGQPGDLAFYYDPVSRKGHTVAWWKRSSCCGWTIFVIEGREPGLDAEDGLPVGPVTAWEATDLYALIKKFNYPNLEVPK